MSMTDDDIKGLLSKEIKAARSQDDTELADKRRRALEYFNGEMTDTPAEEGRSSVVSRDLADTVGWMLPQLMRVFTASDRMVEVEPVGNEDEEFAKQATEGLNYVFWKDNPGYRVLRDASWDSLVIGNGIIKVYHDDTPEYATSFHSGLSDEQVAMLEMTEGVEITHQTTETVEEQSVDPETQQIVTAPVNVHEVKLKRLKSKGRRVIECIPPEDYLRSDDPPGTERPRFEGHRSYKTRSELIRMGFDRKKIDVLGAAGDDTTEQQAREDGYVPPRDIADKSMETVEYVECFLQADVDDDGIAERVRAHYVGPGEGGVLLEWEVWEDEGPFFDIPCDPVPHRWDAKSIADETMDMQRVKTVLWRQALDNTYATNNPTRFAQGEIINPDALFSPSFGEVIFGKVGSDVRPLPIPFTANHAYEALTYADEIVQRRTGVGRQSMALDPEALQNQTATANQNNKDAAYSQVELVARDMAELGWKPVFRALLKLEIKHQDRARTIRLNNKSVTIDPRQWDADMDVTINVGLGTGSRDRDMMMLRSIQNDQIMMANLLAQGGLQTKALEFLPKIRMTAVKSAESSGLRNPEDFYPEVTEEEVAQFQQAASQPKPDPKVQLEMAKIEANRQAEQDKAQAAAIKEQAQMEADLATEEQKQAFEREKLDREYQFKMLELQQKRELELMKLGVTTTSKPGVDGEPGETVTGFDSTPALIGHLMDMMNQLQRTLTAPSEVIRDGQGRAVGVRKVVN